LTVRLHPRTRKIAGRIDVGDSLIHPSHHIFGINQLLLFLVLRLHSRLAKNLQRPTEPFSKIAFHESFSFAN